MRGQLCGFVSTWKPQVGCGVSARTVGSLVVVCARGNGKKKGIEDEETKAQPPRITPLTSKPYGGVKNYIRAVRQQEAAARQSAPGGRVAFRRPKKKPTKATDMGSDEKGGHHTKQPSLANLYGTSQESNPPVLVVDGYNVLFTMRGHDNGRLKQLDFEGQRLELEEDILLYSNFRKVQVTIVYDAMGSGSDEGPTSRDTNSGMTIVFCIALEADAAVVMEAAKCLAEGSPSVTVVTSDQDVKEDCSCLGGAVVMSSESLVKEMKVCKVELQRALKQNQSQYTPGKLGGALSADELTNIRKLRDQLS